MVDAQAPGAARLVRRMAGIPASGDGWQDRLLDRLARLHLLIEGYKRIDALPLGTQADLRTLVGFPTKKEDLLLTQPGVKDRWLVLGCAEEEEDNLRQLRTWLRGLDTGRDAVVFAYAYGNAPLDRSLTPGMAFETEAVFYPGAAPLRAELRERKAAERPAAYPGYGSIAQARAAASAAWSANPWIEQFPMPLSAVVPVRDADGDGWLLRDEAGHALPVSPRFAFGWAYSAISGGRPIPVFGEWDGHTLMPLDIWRPAGSPGLEAAAESAKSA
jgi:hypothetical protein